MKIDDLNTQTTYPDWTIEEIAKELAHCYEIIQSENKDPKVHIEKDAFFLGCAFKIKEWAESKLVNATNVAYNDDLGTHYFSECHIIESEVKPNGFCNGYKAGKPSSEDQSVT